VLDDRPVWVVDLRTQPEGASAAPTRDEALGPSEAIELVAILHHESEAPLLLPIEPTRDRRLLDAIARLLRFAVARGERIPAVAIRYGDGYERALAFERRLPRWAYEGVDARDLPSELERALGRRSR
jgi:hypothetical protein